jgi:drug/metabolite transporter (DMT)-like permease
VVTAGSAAAQLGGATGPAWSATGLLLAAAVASSADGPPILRTPTAAQLAALSYLAVAVTVVVFLAWYAAMKRLGVDRTGLFNGLIPIASLAAVALTGTGTITPLQCLAALTVLAGVIHGLGRTPQVPAGAVNQAGQRPQPSAETTPAALQSEPAPPQNAVNEATPGKAAA